MRSFLGPAIVAVSLVAGSVLQSPSAHGQQIAVAADMGGMGSLNAPVGKTDIEMMVKLLNLSADQKTAANVLLDSYLAEHAKRADVMRTAQETARNDFRENRDPSAFTELATKMEAYATETSAKEKELLENIKGVLDKAQLERWPVWERAHRRANSMNRGMLSGERADLVQLVDRLNLSPAAQKAVDPTLESYAIALDRAIITRDEAQKTAQEEGKKMRDEFQKGGGFGGGGDMTEMFKKVDEMLKKSREASVPVRDINRTYAKQIESALGGVDQATAAKFADAYRRASFPDVYRERYADKALAAAASMEGLDKTQKEAIASLKEQYVRDRKPLEEAAEKAQEDDENNFSLSGMMGGGGGGMMRMMGGSEASQAARKARRELDNSTLDKLKAILGPDLTAKLPDRSADTGDNGGFGPFGGGGMRISPR